MKRRTFITAAAFAVAYALGMLSAQVRAMPYHVLERVEFVALKKSLSQNDEFEHRVKLFDPNARGATTGMIGDSLTNYADWNFLLKRTDILNYGVPSDTSSGLLQRVAGARIEGKTVFLMIGANDISHRLPVDYTAENIRQAVAILSRKNKVYLETTLLTRNAGLNAGVKALNALEASICAGGGCTLLDLNPVIAPSGTLGEDASLDDVHINAASYAKWASVISPLASRI